MNTQNVYQRIHSVMNEMQTVAKNGTNEFHKYKYASEADFVHALRPLLGKHGLVIYPQVMNSTREKVGEKGDYLTSLMVKFRVVNIDKPEEFIETIVEGQGTDKLDKGTYKAMTGAKKYFIAQTFMVATGDDPEKDDNKAGKRTADLVANKVEKVLNKAVKQLPSEDF